MNKLHIQKETRKLSPNSKAKAKHLHHLHEDRDNRSHLQFTTDLPWNINNENMKLPKHGSRKVQTQIVHSLVSDCTTSVINQPQQEQPSHKTDPKITSSQNWNPCAKTTNIAGPPNASFCWPEPYNSHLARGNKATLMPGKDYLENC